jgi:hypothetical protein
LGKYINRSQNSKNHQAFENWLQNKNNNDAYFQEITDSIASKEAGRIYNLASRDFPINDEEWIISIRRRLNIQLTQSNNEQCWNCNKTVDPILEHAMICTSNGKNAIHQPIVVATY